MEITNLVTTPFGIGEKLIFELLKRGESVYTIFSSPKDVPMSFLGKINLKYGFIKFDQEMHIGKALPKNVKNIFHLYEVYTGPFAKMFRCNTGATLSLLDWARNSGVKKFVYLSSGEVYGHGQNLDERSTFNAHSFYATTKFEAEILFRYYYKSFGINTMRLFFPFGKNVNQGYVFNLHQSIKSGDTIDAHYSIISPTYIDDAVEPLIKLREKEGNSVFNICGAPVEVKILIDHIQEMCGKTPRSVSIGTTELSGNNAKATKTLGYTETSLQEALKESFQSN